MEPIEYGLSKLNFKSLKERQRKAVEGYLSDQYVFVYSRTRSELQRHPDHLREWSLDLSTKNRAVPTVSAIVALLVDLMNDQVFSLQREGIAANLPRPFRRVESSRRSMKDFWEQRFYSLPFVATSQRYLIKRALLNLSSLRLIPSSLAYSKSCRYKLDLHKFIAFVRQLSGRSLVNLDKTNNSRSV